MLKNIKVTPPPFLMIFMEQNLTDAPTACAAGEDPRRGYGARLAFRAE